MLHRERTLHGAKLGFKNDEVDRLGQVIVSTCVESFHEVLVTVECRQENDRCPSVACHAFDAASCFEAVHYRHHDVEQDEVRGIGFEFANSFFPIFGRNDVVSELLQEYLEDVQVGSIVINRQHLHFGHRGIHGRKGRENLP